MPNIYTTFRRSACFVVGLLSFLFASVDANAQTVATIGAGSVNSSGTGQTPYKTLYEDGRDQYLISVADLNAAGINGPSILSTLAFNVFTANSAALNGFTIKMGHTALTSLTGAFIVPSDYTTCFSSVVTATAGWNTYNFTTPFNWNGTDNLLVEVCFDNPSWGGNSTVLVDPVPGVTVAAFDDFAVGCNLTFPSNQTTRPQMQITHAPLQLCSSPPSAGTLSTIPATLCSGASFTIASAGGTSGTGLTYQWQSSPDNIAWTNVPGANSSSLSGLLMSGTMYYRLIATCQGVDDTASITVSPAPFLNCYCTSNATSTAYGYIGDVSFAGLNNVSPVSCQTYTDYTNVPAPIVFLGNSENIQVTVAGCSGGSYTHVTKVFIDWNQNGSFSDPGEEFLLTPPSAGGYGAFTGSIQIPANAATGATGMRIVTVETTNANIVNACGTYTWGETEDYLIQVFPLPDDDAGIAGLISPAQPACTVSDSIEVSVVNGGQLALTSVDISYQVNGGAVTTANWTGNLAPGASGPFFVGTTPLNDGDVLKVWASNPNGVADVLPFNDTLEVTLYDALNGPYTVYGVAPDFATVADGLAAVQQRGTCGDVTFNVRSGTYNERMRLQPFPGAGPTARVTIQSEIGIADSVHFTYNVFTTADNYGIWFDGADYYRINALTVRSTNQSFSNNIRINGGSEHNIVENSRFIGDTTSTADNADRWNIRSADGLDNHNTFRNNFIQGGTRALSFGGPSITQREVGNRFENNRIENFWLIGLGLFSQDDLVIHGNVSRSSRPAANMFKFYVRDVYSGGHFTMNSTDDNRPGAGVVLFNVNGQAGNPFVVANNSFSMADSTTNNAFNDGILLTGGSNMDIVHNSIVTYGLEAGTAPIRIGEDPATNLLAFGINVWNNALVNYGAGPAFIANNSSNIGSFIHNGLHTDGQHLLRVSTTNYTLASFQSGTSHGAGCVETDPIFTSADLHTCHTGYDNVGTPYPGVTTDMDGDIRSAGTPDIGSDEFTAAGGFTLGTDLTVCANTPVVLNDAGPFIQGSQYFWSDFSNDSILTVTQPGTYSVLIFTGCNQVQDTVTINHYPAPTASFTSVISFMTGSFSATGSGTGVLTYDWDFGDGNTGSGQNVNHVYTADGSYTVTLTVSDSCANTTVLTETVSITALDIEDPSVSALQIYPNPAMEEVYVSIPVDLAKATVSIRDMAGRELLNRSLNGYKAGETIQIPVIALSKGMYLLQVDAGEFHWVNKLIKE